MFFGSKSKQIFLPDISMVTKKPFSVCTRDKKCRGSVFDEDGNHKYLYWDGSEDCGITIMKCVSEYDGNTYAWFELENQDAT